MMRAWAMLAAAVALGGCEIKQTPTAEALPEAVATIPAVAIEQVETIRGNDAHNRLAALLDGERAEILATLLRDRGERCGAVERSFYQGATSEGQAFWNARCAGGEDWTVAIEPDSSTKLLSCAVRERLGSRCWTRFDAR